MAFRNTVDRLKNKQSALEAKKALVKKMLSSRASSSKVSEKLTEPEKVDKVQVKPDIEVTKIVRPVIIEGNGSVPMYMDGQRTRQYLSPAMRKLADACLEASQNKTCNVLMLWPGKIECLPFAHVLACIEKWSNGYKRGMRTIIYPATQSSFYPLNHIKADRETIHQITNRMYEASPSAKNTEVKESCPEKDLMLFTLNSLGEKAKKENLQPCLNELFPHFYLTTGNKKDLFDQNYKDDFLKHLITKLSSRSHKKSLQTSTLDTLGNPRTAPDAIFALSHKMKKDDLASALRNINGVGKTDLILIDATQSSFSRTDNLRNRITSLLRLVDEKISPAPGILILTDDPQQMTQLRASIKVEVDARKIRYFPQTRGICHPFQNKGLESQQPQETPSRRGAITIKVDVTDKESSKLIDQAYRYRGQMHEFKEVADALANASMFLRTMSNLPSSQQMLNEWLDDSLADAQQRRHYDWIAYKNMVMLSMETGISFELSQKIKIWIGHINKVIESYESGTPLALAMADHVLSYGKSNFHTLVVLKSQFYVMLAEHFLRAHIDEISLGDDQAENLYRNVRFVSVSNLKSEIRKEWATRLVVCFVNSEVLRMLMTDWHIPSHVDLLLTQSSATYMYYSLKPVLDFAEFEPYHARVKTIIDQLKRIDLEGGGVLPFNDLEPPVFSSSLPATYKNDDAPERDMVKIIIDDGGVLYRGLHSTVFVYDPAAAESHNLGFRAAYAENLNAGDQIFVMSDELHDMVETIFKAAGVKLSNDDRFEKILRLYHKQVLEKSKELFPGGIMERARGIRAAMIKSHPEFEGKLDNIRYWLDLETAEDKPFNELMPQAPRNFEHFQAYLNVLGFDPMQIKMFWDGAIKQIRGVRIIDGRHFGDHYSRVLFDPSAAATYDKVPKESLHLLREKALENIYQVTVVVQMAANKESHTS
jgi:hypothetical protein